MGRRSAIRWCLVLVVALAAAGPASGAQPPDTSVTLQANAAHTGEVMGSTLTPPLTVRWSRSDLGAASYPVVVGDYVYVSAPVPGGSYGTILYALDAATGDTVWSRTLGGTYWWSALAYDDGRLYGLNSDGQLRAFDPDTGETLWAKLLPDQWDFSSAPSARDGVVYTGGAGYGGTLYAVRGSDGALLWTVPIDGGDESSPAVDDEHLYVSYACPSVFSFARADGALAWRSPPTCSGGGGDTPVLHDGRLYVRDGASGYVYRASDGKFVDGYGANSLPAFSGDTMLYLSGSTLRAERPAKFPAWTFTADGLSTYPITANGIAYIGSRSGTVYGLDVASGEVVWQGDAGAPVQATRFSDLGAGQGMLVVPTALGVTAFTSGGEEEPAPTSEPEPDPEPSDDPGATTPAPPAATTHSAGPKALAPASGAAATQRMLAAPRLRIASVKLAGSRVTAVVRSDRAARATLAVLGGVRRQVRIARGGARLAAGRSLRLHARLSRSALAKLRRTGRLRVRVLVTATAAGAEPGVASRRALLRR
jgi:outer membrane protein assembly factor BamB